MKIPPLALKIAAQLITAQLMPQASEPADVPQQPQQQRGSSVLSLLGQGSPSPTATEPAPKVVTDTGKNTA